MAIEGLCREYLKGIQQQRAISHSTAELSYREYLGNLIRKCAEVLNRQADFTGEPTR